MKATVIRLLLCFLISAFGYSAGAQSWKELNTISSDYFFELKLNDALAYGLKAIDQSVVEFGDKSAAYGVSLNHVAKIYQKGGDNNNAIAYFSKAMAVRKSTGGIDYIETLNSLAFLYNATDQPGPAKLTCTEAVNLAKSELGATHPAYATALLNMAVCYQLKKDFNAAEPLMADATAIRKLVLGVEDSDYVEALEASARLYVAWDKPGRALPFYTAAAEIRKAIYGAESLEYGLAVNNLGTVYVAMERYAEAEPLFSTALAISRKLSGVAHPGYITSLNNLANVYQETSNYSKAEVLLVEAIANVKQFKGTAAPEYANALNQLGYLYILMQQYDKAATVLEEALANRKLNLGVNHPDYIVSLTNLAIAYQTIHKEKALPLLAEALSLRKKMFGADSYAYSISLNDLANFHQITENYVQAELLYKEALAIRLKINGATHPAYAEIAYNLGRLYIATANYGKAAPMLSIAVTVRKDVLGADHIDYARALNTLANMYLETGSYQKAISLFLQSSGLFFKLLKDNDPVYLASLNSLAVAYQSNGDLKAAEPLFAKVLRTSRGMAEITLATALNNSAAFYQSKGNYELAEQYFKEAVAIRARLFGNQDPAYAAVVSNLAGVYGTIGNFPEAESLYLQALAIRKKLTGAKRLDYAETLNNLALLYSNNADLSRAEPLYLEAMALRAAILGKENLLYAQSANNLAGLYLSLGNYAGAERLYVTALNIHKEVLGTAHISYAVSLNNLAFLYQAMGDDGKAIPLYEAAVAVQQQVLGSDHPDCARTLNNLADVYVQAKMYAKATLLYERVLAIMATALGTKHPDYAMALNNYALLKETSGDYAGAKEGYLQVLDNGVLDSLNVPPATITMMMNLAGLYERTGDFKSATPLFTAAQQFMQQNIAGNFDFLSETEKEQYHATVFNNFERCQSFFLNAATDNAALAGVAYNAALHTKGMILSSGIRTRQVIKSTDNKTTMALYDRWCKLKSILARQYSLPVADRYLNIDSLLTQAAIAEKELSRVSASFNKHKQQLGTSWKDIQSKLKPGEVAIEFISFRYHDGKVWTGKTQYSALLIRKNDAYPKMVKLFTEDRLDSLLKPAAGDPQFIKNLYRGIENDQPTAFLGKELYKLIWAPFNDLLSANDHIYFSPSGLLHQVAFAAIPIGDQLLSDRYQLTQLTSTGVLLVPETTHKNTRSVAAFGGVNYDAVNAPSAGKFVSKPAAKLTSRNNAWEYLPGTLKETAAIKLLADAQKIPIKLYAGGAAMEEAYKQLGMASSPDIIHIATHGFFFPDTIGSVEPQTTSSFSKQAVRTSPNPLNRSGLLFAGANHTWKGERIAKDQEDGILTAYEASYVPLNTTELVVLSACETGLGEIRGSEGVFGLQRAFKAAGAKYLLMSLWKVPDAETAEFMTLFYKALFKTNEIEPSFQSAQTAMRKKYSKDAAKWGAFVLVQ